MERPIVIVMDGYRCSRKQFDNAIRSLTTRFARFDNKKKSVRAERFDGVHNVTILVRNIPYEQEDWAIEQIESILDEHDISDYSIQ